MSFAWTRPSSKAGGIVVDDPASVNTTARTQGKVTKVVIHSEAAAIGSAVRGGKDRTRRKRSVIARVDKRVVVDHPAGHVLCAGGSGNHAVTNPRAPIGVALMPQEYIAVDFEVTALADTDEESCALQILEDVVARDQLAVGVDGLRGVGAARVAD